jgi:isoaspartyl peptidase/L-asparaginase-like protein (Ntn-hydrolase superfamily)
MRQRSGMSLEGWRFLAESDPDQAAGSGTTKRLRGRVRLDSCVLPPGFLASGDGLAAWHLDLAVHRRR